MKRQTKVLQALRQTREWKQLRRTASNLVRRLAPRPEQLAPSSPYSYKFLDYEFWMKVNVNRAIGLGLDRATGLRILDIGTGTAMFPFVCRFLGHDVTTTEIPRLSDENALIYPPMRRSVGVYRPRKLYIYKPNVNLTGTFDMVCAFMICFGRKWRAKDWKTFTCCARRNIVLGGRLILAFNRAITAGQKKTFYSIGSFTTNSIIIHNDTRINAE